MNSDTFNLCEAAICMWDWAIERDRTGRPIPWDDREFSGVAGLRATLIGMAPAMEIAYRHAVDAHEYDSCFDWEFVPRVLDSITCPADLTRDPTGVVDALVAAGTLELYAPLSDS